MAKLVEILARELKEWPEECEYFTCDPSGEIRDNFSTIHDFYPLQEVDAEERTKVCAGLGDDIPRVTRAQWEAERARIAREEGVFLKGNETVFEINHSTEEQELADIACGKRSKEDQELWDKVAMDQFRDFMQSEREQHFSLNQCDYARLAAEAADAFMAERAKRLKGV